MSEAKQQSREWNKAEREINAAADVLAAVATLIEDDPEMKLDVIEGETGLLEILDQIVLGIDNDKIFLDGIKARKAELAEREARIKRRVDARRALIEKAMTIADLKSIPLALATITLSQRKPGLLIHEESEIPARFWNAGAPKLDRKALADAVKDGQTIAGAGLDNGSASITIRVK